MTLTNIFRKIRNIVLILTPILCIWLETNILRGKCSPILYNWPLFLLLINVVSLIILFLVKKSTNFFKQSVLLSFSGGIASFSGVFILLYTLIHLGILSNQMYAYVASQSSIDLFLISLNFLVFPFIAYSIISPSGKRKLVNEEDRRVLVTALSRNDAEQIIMFKECGYDEQLIIEELKKAQKPSQWNWMPILRMLERYKNINNIIVILSPEVNTELGKARDKLGENKNVFKSLILDSYGNRHFQYTEVHVSTMNKFDDLFIELKPKINSELKRYRDSEILFGISPGTSVLTASLVFLSMRGLRGAVFQKQSPPYDLDPFSVDVLTIEELWDELKEHLSAK